MNNIPSKNKIFASNQFRIEKEYWMDKLDGELLLSSFPYDYQGKKNEEQSFDLLSFELSSEVSEKLRRITSNSNPKLHIVLTAGLFALLHRYTGNTDIITATPIDKQDLDVEFTNTVLALRNQLHENMTFKELVLSTRQTIIEAIENQNYPIEVLLDHFKTKFDNTDFILFDTALLIESIHDRKYLLPGMPNILFSFLTTGERITARVEYNVQFYEKNSITRITHHFLTLLKGVLSNPDILLSNVSLLTEQEEKQLIFDLNNTGTDYPHDKIIHELIDEQVERTPGKVALIEVESNREITYLELKEQYYCFANLLHNRGIKTGSIVGIIADRSIETVVGILSILKTGAAYLPIDPAAPQERIDFIMEDSSAEIILTKDSTGSLREANMGETSQLIRKTSDVLNVMESEIFIHFNPKLETQISIPVSKLSSILTSSSLQSLNIAYIIYTSGSTGKPKGVMVEHRSLVNYIWWAKKNYVKTQNANFPLFTSMAFDLTVTSIFTPLITGHAIYIYKNDAEEQKTAIDKIFENKNIGVIKCTPSHLKIIRYSEKLPKGLKCLIIGGEELETQLAKDIYQKFNDSIEIYNEYGPTETTVGSMIYKFNPNEDKRKFVPIGGPIHNTKIYILDKYHKPVPVGVSGELHISGIGLARGYLNSPELSAEKFSGNQLSSNLYKTGDLAQWLSDGNIEFLGRIDNQVKIRGYRVHISEIEFHILNYVGVKNLVVLALNHSDGSKYLCAYVVWVNSSYINELKKYLLQFLPDYMVPDFFVTIDEIPLTINGKVDKKKLPNPVIETRGRTSYISPRNKIETKMIEIWSELLSKDNGTIGIMDNFFDLGGNSLNATGLISKIHKEFNVNLRLIDVFQNPILIDMVEFLKKADLEAFSSIAPVEEKEHYVLSSSQKRLFFLQKIEPELTSYNVPLVVLVEGEDLKKKLEKTFKKLLKRHESLRTTFQFVNDTPVQKVNREVEFKIEYYESSQADEIIKNFIRPFDLSISPLLRVGLIKSTQAGQILMMDMHHIITDGISHGILINDFIMLYNDIPLSPLKLQYKDYSEWQQRQELKDTLKKQEEYWLKEFDEPLTVLNLPTDYPRPPIQSFEGNSIGFETSEEETRRLNVIAGSEGATLFMILLAIFDIFLSKICNQEDITIGAPIAGRRHADLNEIIGMFVNTIVLRNHVLGDESFAAFLAKTKEKTLNAFENQDYQFEDLVEKISVQRDMSRNPVFNTLFVLRNMFDPSGILSERELYGLKIKPYVYENKITKFDLTLNPIEIKEKLYFSFEYCTKLFRKETIEKFIAYFKKILSIIIKSPGILISKIDILSEEEKNRILYEFNDTEALYPKEKMIHQLFEEQVERTPDNISVSGPSIRFAQQSFLEIQLTYKELNEKANRLGYELQAKGVGPDIIVGVIITRSVEMITGIIGILKAGGAYLPIEPDYPQDRIDFMLKNSGASLLITKDDFKELPNLPTPKRTHFALMQATGNRQSVTSLAYIIYTSGSTGKPKGVCIDHHSVVNRLNWMMKVYPIGEDDVILQKTRYTFDVSIWELFWWSFHGASVCLMKAGGEKDPGEIVNFIERYSVTVLHFVPSMLSVFLEYIEASENITRLSALRRVFASGETLSVYQVERFNRLVNPVNKAELINLYGPTEATVDVSYFNCSVKKELLTIPIGKPIDNIGLYVIDKGMQLQPVGITGELCISGVGLARGYLNNPELTAEKFISFTPISQPPNIQASSLYRTGDLAKCLSDGNIEFIGRIDSQVKIRGFRIELGEVESRLSNYPGIRDIVVVDITDERMDRYLCAYIISDYDIAVSELREYLLKYLPDYMIPLHFVQLEKIPLTANGKVDKKALPVPEITSKESYIAPRNQLEKKLIEIWAGVLVIEKEKIGINDNFFHLGGHSLKATILTSRVDREFSVKLPLLEFFKKPTIREMSEIIKKMTREEHISIEQVEEKEFYSLSSAQKRLFILQQMALNNTNYNMPRVIPFSKKIDKQKVYDVFNTIMMRHESLRTSFLTIGEVPVQRIHRKVEFRIEEENITSLPSRVVQPFDLSKPPLLRVKYINNKEGSDLLLIDIHHIVCDGISLQILENEFWALYTGEKLPPSKLQYKDYSEWQNASRQKEKLIKQENYWINRFSGELPVLNLPTDFPRPIIKSVEGYWLKFILDEMATRFLKNIASRMNATLYMVILSVFAILLSKMSGQDDIIIGTPSAGRNHADLEQVIGMLINTILLRCFPESHKTFEDFLSEVKEQVSDALENQDYQFDDLVDKLSIPRDTGRNPIFDVMVNMLNYEEVTGKIPVINENKNDILDEYFSSNAKFDINMMIIDYQEQLLFNIEYCSHLFKGDTIGRMMSYFRNIVAEIGENSPKKIMDIEIISMEIKQEILERFNKDLTDITIIGKVFQDILLDSLYKNRDKIAIEYGEKEITYSELDKQSGEVSAWMLEHGFERGSFTGIYLENKIQLLYVIIGIIKAECVFVPLDTLLPTKRIAAMITRTDMRLVFTDEEHKQKLEENGSGIMGELTIVKMDNSWEYKSGNKKDGATNKNKVIYGNDYPIYIYFTSGTTGMPEAILGRNVGLLQFIRWEMDQLGITSEFRVSLFIPIGFDPFLRNIFTPLCAGGVLCVPLSREAILESSSLIRFIERNRIMLIHCVPTIFRLFNIPQLTPEYFKELKYVIFTGEALNPIELSNWFDIFHGRIQLVNYYGPTEVTMVKMHYFIREGDEKKTRIPFGDPIRGASVIILDDNFKLCDKGIVGEIYIRTPYLSLGYYKNTELTEMKFIRNPFNPDDKTRIYRTGDLGRELFDGRIEFLGRKDGQVKIRGIRIEYGEIENLLQKHEKIKRAVVRVKEISGDKYLCAYIVWKKRGGDKSEEAELREYLAERFPVYLIPSYFISIDEIPVTLRGKIDWEALPVPERKVEGKYIAPNNAIEGKLQELWAEVLGIEKNIISMDSNFFDLGGHSLKVMILLSKIRRDLDVNVPLVEMFKSSTIKGLSTFINRAVEDKCQPIESTEEKEFYPLSSAQKRLYVLNRMEPEKLNYNLPFICILEIENISQKEKIAEVFMELVNRHESFRTSFHLLDDQLVQKIQTIKSDKFEIEYFWIKIGDDPKIIINKFIRPFDLSKAPLLRVGLIKESERRYFMMVDMHHIISDGVSRQILIKDFHELYRNKQLIPLNLCYKDYSEWLKSQEEQGYFLQQEEYWLKEFQEQVPKLNLPIDYPRPAIQNFEGDLIRFELSIEETKRLNEIAQANGGTLFMVILAIYTIFLAKVSGQDDIAIGTPIAGRRHSDLEKIVGMFVNTLVLRNYPWEEQKLNDFFYLVKNRTVEAFENQDYQFEDLVERVALNRDMSRNPLFDSMLVMQNTSDLFPSENVSGNENEDLKIEFYNYVLKTSKFDLTLITNETREKLYFSFEYCTRLFREDTIIRFIGYFKKIVSSLIEETDRKISDIEIISEKEKEEILTVFNATEAFYPQHKTIHGLFEEQATRTPNHIAIIGLSMSMNNVSPIHITYVELNEMCNRLAYNLKENGIGNGPNIISAIKIERSIEMVIGIMGILKAGGAYLPIDPGYPQARIDFMLKDSGSVLLITKNDFKELPNLPTPKITGLSLMQTSVNRHSATSLAYVIYTSGSTGKPKGVCIEHHSVVNRLNWMQNAYPIGEEDVILQKTTFTFDVSVWELFWWSWYGASLCLLKPGEEKDPGQITHAIKKHKVSVLHFVPSMLNVFLEYIESSTDIMKLSSLKQVFASGESLILNHVERFNHLVYPLNKATLVNLYGPTEATVDVSHFNCSVWEGEKLFTIPIGKPIDNIGLYIIDKHMNLQPIGIAGELSISGIGLARGYLNNPELSLEKFAGCNWEVIGHRLYKTGDLARLLPNGNIEFLGRIDHQVKVRGFRIELGEIENRLSTHPEIKDAVVICKRYENGDNLLCAYIVPVKSGGVSEQLHNIKQFLSKYLPDYMIPHYLIEIEKIPLSPNGKIDRKSLSEPGERGKILGDNSQYIRSGNKTEETLVEIWEKVLGRDSIGINDNFFNIGGDSIKAISIVSRINTSLQTNIRIADLFNHNTVKGLAGVIINLSPDIQDKKVVEEVEREVGQLKQRIILSGNIPEDVEDIFPMSDIEKGMIFHAYNHPMEAIYHDQFVYFRKYINFEPDTLKMAIELMAEKHSILRTSFNVDDFNEAVHFIHKAFPAAYKHIDISALENAEQIEYIKAYMADDRKDRWKIMIHPLWRMATLALGNDNICAIWTFHHAILDGWSNASLMTELNNTYLKLKSDRNYAPSRLQISYKDFIIREMAEKKKQENIDFWTRELEDYKRVTFPDAGKESEKEKITFNPSINEALNENIIALPDRYNISMKHICFAAYIYMLSMLTYENDIVVGLISNNRPEIEDGDKLIGCFLNTLPFRIAIPGEISCEEFIQMVDEKLVMLKQYEKVTFYEIVRAIGERNGTENPILDTIFNYIDFHIYKEVVEEDSHPAYNFEEKIDGYEVTNTLFNLTISPYLKGISVRIKYSASIMSDDTLEKVFGYFLNVFKLMISGPDELLRKDKIISSEEKQKLLYEFNHTEAEYPMNKTIYMLFEEQLERTPDNIALIGPSVEVANENSLQITYKELSEITNRLSYELLLKGVEPDNIVGNMIERSVETVIGIMAILKAGGAYLPINPDYPEERRQYMIKDSGAVLVMSNIRNLGCWEVRGTKISATGNWQQVNGLAYIIYTSGSTGRPKGVMVEHRNLINLVFGLKQRIYDLKPGVHIALISPFIFDASIKQIFPSLLLGHKLFIIPDEVKLNGGKLIELFKRWIIQISDGTPAHLKSLLNFKEQLGNKFPLEKFLIGGEGLEYRVVKKFTDYIDKRNFKIINVYGPTECCDVTSIYDAEINDRYAIIPIGSPISNVRISILGLHKELKPIGVPGEIYISGTSVSRGYLNNPELMIERFVNCQLFVSGVRSYRTGDLARWLPDGNIEFLGRIDHQVKIRGFRIELGEIENQILKINGIKETIVLVREKDGGDKYICAYFISEREYGMTDLRGILSRELPDYMIPSFFVQMEKMPLTLNGKIDRKALPEPQITLSTMENSRPPNELEEKLMEIWMEILGIEKEKISISHNFFEIGGDSLNLISLVSKIHREFGIELPFAQIFSEPTITSIARWIDSKKIVDSPVMLLNRPSNRNIFLFPPQVAYGVFYTPLASIISDYTFYAFNFIEEEDRLEQYARLITEIQPEGPYILFGYSAGMRSTFQVAKTLENKGYKVSDIIFIDCFFTEGRSLTLDEDFMTKHYKTMNDSLEQMDLVFLKEKVIEKSVKFLEYCSKVIHLDKINANVHLIVSEEAKMLNQDILRCWDILTSKDSFVYDGFGKHTTVFAPDNIERNVKIIRKILDGIENW